MLGDDKVRELLQRRVLLRPVTVEGALEVILHLTDSGALAEIPVPTSGPRRPLRNARRPQTGGRKRPRTDRRETAPGGPVVASPRERTSGFAAVALGPCPLCRSEVVELEKSYSCGDWKGGCRFAIWKTIAGKKTGVRAAQALLRTGRSPLLKGFWSKSGRPFEARLKLDGSEVRFDFEA